MCTTAFLVEISQQVKFGDLTQIEAAAVSEDTAQAPWSPVIKTNGKLPTITFDELPEPHEPGEEPRLTDKEEDALLRESTAGFANWVTSFIRRVILLLENLPEESSTGQSGGGTTEIAVVDSVAAACSQICVHLSEPLFDLVLNLIYDFASTTVRSNAVRAVHQVSPGVCMGAID
jgi:proteasome activator subunit 4